MVPRVLRKSGPIADTCSYTKAIEVSVKKDSVFYSNRAACERLTFNGVKVINVY